MIELVDTFPDTNVQQAEYKRLLGFPRERVMEDLGGQVLGLAAAAGSARGEGVHTVEIALVERGEALGVGLRGLDQEALVLTASRSFSRR